MDLRANIDTPIILRSLERSLIPTGIFIELPLGFEAQIRPRSGLAAKRGLTCLNSPGTIDADYRGEIKVILVNLSNETQTIEPEERIAQMVIAKHERVTWQEVNVLNETERGAGGSHPLRRPACRTGRKDRVSNNRTAAFQAASHHPVQIHACPP